MNIVDLTRPMTHQTLIDLGGRRADGEWMVKDIDVTWLRDWERGDNGAQCQWYMSDHFGTHVDAPVHVVQGGSSVDQLDLNRMLGEAVVLDCSFANGRGLSRVDFEVVGSDVRPGDIVLIYSAERPGKPDRYVTDQTYVTAEGAEWLVEKGVAAVGVEPSGFENVYQRVIVDRCYSAHVTDPWPAHRICLSHNVYIIEGLTNLAALAGRRVNFVALPLPVPKSSGSPVRAVAWWR